MDKRYKIILSRSNLYKEIELAPDALQVKVGTGIDCDVRLRKELFFGPIELLFLKNGTEWTVHVSDNLYITTGDVRKLITKDLRHGDKLQVKYQNSDMVLFMMDFMLDFDYESKKYEIEIDISGKDFLTIGGNEKADIVILDPIIGEDYLSLEQNGESILLRDSNTKYGVYANGSKIDGKKEVKNADFFSIAGYSFYYKKRKLYTEAKHAIRFNNLPVRKIENQVSHFEYPDFIRSTRIQYNVPETEIEIKQPQPRPQKNKKNILFTLIPSLTMLILMVVMRGIMGSGGTFVLYSVCSMGVGIVMSVVTYIYDGKEYKTAIAKRETEYRKYIEEKEQEVIAARENELRIRNRIYESLDNDIKEVFTYGRRLFEKSKEDKDFLDVYLGEGKAEAAIPVKYTEQDFIDAEDTISRLPEEIEKKYHFINKAPIISRFKTSSGVGIVGDKAALQNMLRNITLDLATRHFYKEVKLYYVLKDSEIKSLKWIRWLRHVYNDEIGIRNIICDDESRKVLLENLYAILSNREAIKKENESVQFDTNYVIFVFDLAAMRKHPVARYIENASDYGFTFVFFAEYEEYIPKRCAEIIRLNSGENSGIILESANGDIQTEFNYKQVPNTVAEMMALKLGAVYVEEVSLESELTTSISMYELLNIFSVDDLDLKERWESSQVYKSMAAPLGVKTKNEIVYLDISDRADAHGPHGLVAGTTGSGKSEILQTYVLSMATLFHPYEVGFVIIDFKGGGMANQFKGLPHLMGTITNIDGKEINRSLLSIKAELVKRQAYLAAAGVNHINDYIKLYKKKAVVEPLPHLIIIVDEFAELKAEFPDFMKELISAARIGRTLGVHLILATQKPAGVVDAQIWSNSKFKLCLKVQTKEDSNEVIKTPLAAEIVEPGRAYFQVGNNEIFELFQSAYSGVKISPDGNDKAKSISVYSLNDWGKKTLVYTNKKKSKDQDTKNQLQAIVGYVGEYCKKANIKMLSGICLPPLEDVVKRSNLGAFERKDLDIVVPVGIYDDPQHQEQGSYCINLSENNTYIVGSAMTGKTTLLQTVLLQLIKYYSPAEVNVYIIDCGNMTLKVFENSSIVGGVALTSEEDKVGNLFKLMFRTMEERKKIFSGKGLGTHRAYVEAGYTDLPQIILVIDNVAAFREYYDNLSEDFLGLSREGSSLGISIVATATQTNAMNYKALSNYGTRVALVCNDTNEYMNLFDRCRMEPKNIPGRGLCVMDKRILEFQTALCVDGDKEYVRADNIRKEIAASNGQYENLKAAPIPMVPEIIEFDKIKGTSIYNQKYSVPIGINYETVKYEMLDLQAVGLLATLGKEKSGRTNFVRHLFAAIQKNIFGSLTEAYVIDSPERKLETLRQYGFVQKYTTDINDLESIVEIIEQILKEREQKVSRDATYDLSEETLILLAVENSHFGDTVQANKGLAAKMVQLVKQYKKYKFAVIISEVENTSVPFGASEFIKYVKENKKFIVFDDLNNVKFFDVSVKQQKDNAKPLVHGDAFVCVAGAVQRIKTIYMKEGE